MFSLSDASRVLDRIAGINWDNISEEYFTLKLIKKKIDK